MAPEKRPAPGAAGRSSANPNRANAASSSSSQSPSSSSSNAQAPPPNWKKRKFEKAQSARHIQTQMPRSTSSAHPPSASTSASKHHTSSSSASALASAARTANTAQPQPLPPQLDLEAAISSRAFQIRSFQNALRNAKNANTTRAWQLLPRHARRRAASHNLLRLPTRLRPKARSELSASNTLAKTRAQIRSRLPTHGIVRATLRRQKLAQRAAHPNRKWLETHLWHAKRFRMSIDKGKSKESDQGVQTSRWGFVLPETTMMKSHKASWRSALEKVTLHDASYHAVFRLGAERILPPSQTLSAEAEHDAWTLLLTLLDQALDRAGISTAAASPGNDTQASADGAVQVDAILTAQRPSTSASTAAQARAAIAPVRILRLPQRLRFIEPDQQAASLLSRRQAKKKAKTSKDKAMPGDEATSMGLDETENAAPCPGRLTRIIRTEALLVIHPAAALDLRRALKHAGVIMTDEDKATVQLESANVVRLTATQLDSAPDPWVAAGGKDTTASKLKKRKRAQSMAATSSSWSSSSAPASSQDFQEWTVLDRAMQRQRQHGFNIFELVGPDAGKLLASVLKPIERGQPARGSSAGDAHAANSKEAFHALKCQPAVVPTDTSKAKANKGARAPPARPLLPDNTVLAFEVHDPRLSFPPKLVPTKSPEVKQQPIRPAAELASSRLLAYGATAPRFSKGEIDSRRAKLPIPGTRLKPDSRDDIVPVVVIRRRLTTRNPAPPQPPSSTSARDGEGERDSGSGSAGSSGSGVDGYTLILPRGWGMAFFLSLANTHQSGSSKGARVLGQRQIQHQSLEIAALRTEVPAIASSASPDSAGAADGQASSSAVAVDDGAAPARQAFEGLFFPRDWIGTRAYAEIEKEACARRKDEWARRPKGKRVEHVFVDESAVRPLWTTEDASAPAATHALAANDQYQSKSRSESESKVSSQPSAGEVVAALQARLRSDRLGTSRPFPFGGVGVWEWLSANSERLFGAARPGHDPRAGADSGSNSNSITSGGGGEDKPWLLPLTQSECYDVDALTRRVDEAARRGSHVYANALVPVKLSLTRKGTAEELSSVLLPPSYDDQQMWMQHVDVSKHPLSLLCKKPSGSGGAALLDRETVKREVERRLERLQLGRSAPPLPTALGHAKRTVEAQLGATGTAAAAAAAMVVPSEAELDGVHDRCADWNGSVGMVLSGDYALGRGRGFGIAAMTLKAWIEVVKREEQTRTRCDEAATRAGAGSGGGRKKRNPVESRFLVLVRAVGSDVVRPCTAVPIHL
ncbi:uncharacterized protein PFL1_05468 [Pseudozyma flocculosa PF-1]|uniref:Related to Ribonucleases P/MRP protein subunit POP1 n=2 Tax=Pseudozyma flocculosa TaxID=84751 RepID=A0A5C3FEK2_9BASI|nr:uncharacterized protein PFL1_05468 [Pseudozyma flocculosa PF-1]EPQ26833.1 hypothetical protein PFL1_05468 [Pseudozyma flocculosa PF-1]SPO42097.1 related to Ribonucleases P/MRP protein subunit POP1 [Pseudozyma flocculosa]